MTALKDIRKRTRTVDFESSDGGTVSLTVRALSLGQILDLVQRHAAIGAAFFDQENRGLSIAAAIMQIGGAAVCDTIDAGLRAEPGTAADADLDAIDQLRLVSAVIDLSLDQEALGKLMAEARPTLERLGLAGVIEQIET